MSNRSIAWWLKQIGLPQYTQTLEREYYGLEGLLMVTDGDLMLMGVEDADHRAIILTNLQKHQQSLQPGSPTVRYLSSTLTRTERFKAGERKVSRKFSLSSSDLFRQSIMPRLSRRGNNTLSNSCSDLHPIVSQHHTINIKPKHSKRKSVGIFIAQVFSSHKDMEPLKKELEEELKLSSDDIRSHAWYHGQLHREGAEELLKNDGDFLVRDSSTSGGDYVLSCMWNKQCMHFKIIRIVLRPKQGYSRELFQFESDQFDNIASLVRFHVGGRRPISQSSGAVITCPITRTLPLRIINERHTARLSSTCSLTAPPSSAEKGKRRSLSSTHSDILQVNSYNLLRSGSQPANLETVGRPSLQSAQSDSNIRPAVPQCSPAQDPLSPVFRTGSAPLLSPSSAHSHSPGQLATGGCTLRGSDGQLHCRAPPKPIRVSALFPVKSPTIPRIQVNPASLYDELVPQVPQSMLPKGPAARLRAQEKWNSRARITETSFTFLEAQRDVEEKETEVKNEEREQAREEVTGNGDDWRFLRPEVETTTSFRLDSFRSLLLPDNNRPLEQSVLHSLKQLFASTDANTIALHMLSVDCQVARVTGVTGEQKRMMGVKSGLELITLPHGSQLRQDLLERHHLLALGVAVDVLGCTGSVNQRAAVLHKVIQLAQALRSTAHDLYGFSAVMKALEFPQLMRLEMTWRVLRRNHTESAVMFEKTLKPFMKALNEAEESVMSGPVSLPHMVPLLKLMEGDDDDGVENSERGCQLLYNILQSSRHIAHHANDYQQHAHTLLSAGWDPIPELLEIFCTEFALRLFWGQTGAQTGNKERYDKFDKILTVLSNKLEPAYSANNDL